jgi:hypothetical protein
MKLTKRETYTKDNCYWQIGNSNYYLSADKSQLLLFEPYTVDDGNYDVELFEGEGHGSTWKLTRLDTELLLNEIELKEDIITTIKRHLKGIEKAVEKLEKE